MFTPTTKELQQDAAARWDEKRNGMEWKRNETEAWALHTAELSTLRGAATFCFIVARNL